MNYGELIKLNKEYLDTLDLKKYMDMSDDVLTIIEMIENDYDDKECLPSELQGCIFNGLTTNEIADYLGNRYGKKVLEEVIYKLV